MYISTNSTLLDLTYGRMIKMDEILSILSYLFCLSFIGIYLFLSLVVIPVKNRMNKDVGKSMMEMLREMDVDTVKYMEIGEHSKNKYYIKIYRKDAQSWYIESD